MLASVLRSVEELRRFGRLWWLPACGRGSGLDDGAWAPVLQISEAAVPQVLAALASASVPAFAAPARGEPEPQEPDRESRFVALRLLIRQRARRSS